MLIGVFLAQLGPTQADHWVHCDIHDHSYTGPGSRYLCRPVPDYFLDNQRAQTRYFHELTRRKDAASRGGREFVLPDICDFGFVADFCDNRAGHYHGGSGDSSQQHSSAGSAGFGGRPNALGSRLFAQQIDGPGIGLQWIIDAGFIAAYDIWGEGAPGEVCLEGLGSLLFIDTGRLPRVNSWLDATQREGQTCATLDRPGMLVLMPAGARFSECRGTATGHLKVRRGPSLEDEVIGHLRSGTTVQVISRNRYWVEIVYQGKTGWVGAAYMNVDCGGTVEPAPEPASASETPTPARPQPQDCPVVTTGKLRVRAGPSLDEATIGFVRRGVTLRPITRRGAWIEIAYRDASGWVGADYVSQDCADRSVPAPNEPQDCSVITTGKLRVRAGPSLDEATIGFVRAGVTLRPMSRRGAWIEFAYRDASGWVGAAFVTEEGDCN